VILALFNKTNNAKIYFNQDHEQELSHEGHTDVAKKLCERIVAAEELPEHLLGIPEVKRSGMRRGRMCVPLSRVGAGLIGFGRR